MRWIAGTCALIASLLFLCSYNAHAYYYKQYTTSNKLISNTVYHSLRDHKGYMWFFTDKGVSKFDGAVFKNFTVSDGLSDHDIFSGYEDRLGRLWLFTSNGNPCFIKNDTLHNSGNDLLLKRLPVIPYIESVCENADSSFYIGYINGMVIKVCKNDFNWVIKNSSSNYDLFSMNKIGDSLKIYKRFSTTTIVNDKTICANKETENLNFHDYDNLLRADSNGIKIFDGNNTVWQYNDKSLNPVNVLHIYFDKKDHVFCGTRAGLVIIDIRAKTRNSLFEHAQISSISQDSYGNFWITTIGNGIFYLNKNLDNIRSLAKIDNYTAYSNQNGELFFINGANVYNFNKDSLQLIDLSFNTSIQPLYINDKHFFFNAERVMWHLQRDNGKVNKVQGRLKNLYPIDSNKFLAVENDFLSEVYLQNGEFVQVNALNFPHLSQSCFHNNILYFSSRNCIYAFNTVTLSYLKIDSMSQSSINNFYWLENQLIVTTNGKNILSYTPVNGSMEKNIKQYPFACFDILKIDANGYKYILNTDKGYYLINELDGNTPNLQKLEYPIAGEDLLSVNVANHHAICNINGYYYIFDDSLINKEKEPPKFFIEKIIVNEKTYAPGIIQIKNSAHTHLSVELARLKFDPVPVDYEYRIIHNDTSQWFSTSNDKLDIFLEKSGHYIIEVRAVTENKNRSGSQYLTLEISPPFYYSLTFYTAVLAFLILAVLFFIRRYNQQRLALFQNELNYLQLENRAINSLLNPHFIFNAINNIQSLINTNSPEHANNYLAILSKLIRQNIDNLQFSFIPVSKELNLIRNYITLQNLRFDNRISLIIHDHSGDPDHIQVPPLLIHTFVENSVVHGFRKDNQDFTITVELDLSVDDYLIIKILDNGTGIQQKNNSILSEKLSLGIDFMRKRLSRISDFYKVTFSLEINDRKDTGFAGTEVIIILYAKFKNEDKTNSATVGG